MLLRDVLDGTGIILDKTAQKIEIKKIEISPDDCKGCLFFDLKGEQNVNKILERGANFVIRLGKKNKQDGNRVFSHIDPRKILALASKNFFHKACDELKIVGITGTNGKTSTAKIVKDIILGTRKKVAVVGTIGCEFNGRHFDTGFTTPDPHILHSLFLKMLQSGVEYVVMEVSAHSIALKKLEGIKFEVLALTNITQDHLDFFKDMELYAKTKCDFFTHEHAKHAVICVDDEWGLKLSRQISIPFASYGIENPSDIFAIDIKSSFAGSEFICNILDEDIFRAETPLVGEYNVLNCLCAMGITKALGFEAEDIKNGIAVSTPELGRFNIISLGGLSVVIDYAHTPDGLEKVLRTAKSLCKNNLFVLFGCGGNRDISKRAIMGGISELYADKVFLTSDNPRFEDPIEIIRDIEKGMIKSTHEVIPDRKEAIRVALSTCKKGDCLIIAGKGGEKYQDIKGQKIAYSDFDEVFKFFRGNIRVLEAT